LAGKLGLIKPHLVIAEPSSQPHIGLTGSILGKDGLPVHQHISRGDDPAFEWRVGMAWSILFVAGLLEITWAIGLKYTEGFSRLVPSVVTLAAMAGSIVLLGLALKSLPVGTAYAVWTGIGAVGTATLGIVLFGEPATALRLASIALIVAGIVGLKLVT
jgi:quaternary ammonium compound-resistance protein SugE